MSITSRINRALRPWGVGLVRKAELESYRQRYRRVVSQLLAVSGHALPENAARAEYLANLVGTDVAEGIAVVQALHDGLTADGDVCEFGVAQGATSALLANELAHHGNGRCLWLYDSFKGFAPPTRKDVLLDDILKLGDMDAYAGQWAIPRSMVESRLAEVEGWPLERTRIMEGFFTTNCDLPNQVAFAYIDFDMYQPIKDALDLLHDRTPQGAVIVVDDYGFFSAGAQTAVDEFLTEHPTSYLVTHAPPYTDPYVRLDKRKSNGAPGE